MATEQPILTPGAEAPPRRALRLPSRRAIELVALGLLVVAPLVLGDSFIDRLGRYLLLAVFAMTDVVWGYGGMLPLAMPPSLAGPPTWSPSSPPRSTGCFRSRCGRRWRSAWQRRPLRLGDRRLHLLRQVCPARGGVRRGHARRLVPVGEVDERRWVGDRRAERDPVRRPARDRTRSTCSVDRPSTCWLPCSSSLPTWPTQLRHR